MLWHFGVMTVRLLKPDCGGLTILCLPCRSCPVVSSSSYVLAGNCRDGHFSLGGHCMPCFCFGITKNCQSTGRYRNQIGLRFTEEEDFKGTKMIEIQLFAFNCGFTIGECNWNGCVKLWGRFCVIIFINPVKPDVWIVWKIFIFFNGKVCLCLFLCIRLFGS